MKNWIIGIAATAVVAVMVVMAGMALDAEATPAPVYGDVHAETTCVWVPNSRVHVLEALRGDWPPTPITDDLTDDIRNRSDAGLRTYIRTAVQAGMDEGKTRQEAYASITWKLNGKTRQSTERFDHGGGWFWEKPYGTFRGPPKVVPTYIPTGALFSVYPNDDDRLMTKARYGAGDKWAYHRGSNIGENTIVTSHRCVHILEGDGANLTGYVPFLK